MSMYFLRPGHLHNPALILSCTQEAGLQIDAPSVGADNVGSLRLRASGIPEAATTLNVQLQAGGAPFGWARRAAGQAAGAAVIHKPSTNAGDEWLGYNDTPFHIRTTFPIPYNDPTGAPSTPRQLPDGTLGILMPPPATGSSVNWTFYKVAPDYSVTSTTITDKFIGNVTQRSDYCVLPSGRLIACLKTDAPAGGFLTWYSEDNGATWNPLASINAGATGTYDCLCCEAVGDEIVVIIADLAGSGPAFIFLSKDGGSSFTLADNTTTLRNPRTCVIDDVVIVAASIGGATDAVHTWRLVPGGGLADAVNTGIAAHDDAAAIVTRDDGTLWSWGWNEGGNNTLDMTTAVSRDGGLTWEDPAGGVNVMDLHGSAYGDIGYDTLVGGMWRGRCILLGTVQGAGASDHAIHAHEFGGWESVTDWRDSVPYDHTYVPIDYPHNLGWTRTNISTGAAITNRGPLNIVSTLAANSDWVSSTSIWQTGNAGDGRRVRFRVRVNSGGAIISNDAILVIAGNDGTNEMPLTVRFGAANMRFLDSAGTLATVAADLTDWVELLVFYYVGSSGNGSCTLYAKEASADLWTLVLDNQTITGTVGATDHIQFGGTATSAATDWDIANLQIGDDVGDNYYVEFNNPGDLEGRPLSAAYDVWIDDGIRAGAFGTGGVKGDTYTLQSDYSYAKEDLWEEHRSSRQLRSTADGANWEVIFDAGATALFKGDLVALFGTNFRGAQLQLNSTNSWGSPAETIGLSANLWSGSIGTSVRGPGYVGPPTSQNWRPGQYKSTKGRRYFLEVGGSTVYEITDNDEERLYIDGVDFTATTGTLKVFGDRMATAIPFAQYRYMRLFVGAQQTSDDHYRCGSLIFDKSFSPNQLYDHGFVDRTLSAVEVYEVPGGYRGAVKRGPRRRTLAVAWPPLARTGPAGDLALRLQSLYEALEGSLTPFVFWRDSSDLGSLYLVRFEGTFAAPNVWNEGSSALTRIEQLVISEEL